MLRSFLLKKHLLHQVSHAVIPSVSTIDKDTITANGVLILCDTDTYISNGMRLEAFLTGIPSRIQLDVGFSFKTGFFMLFITKFYSYIPKL